jgi:putative Ca2+/H+ antiporter (TMEM165/GDT1 family)
MFLMELPDKTMIALIVMGTRARPLMVFVGGATAFVAQMGLAVGAGSLLTLMPRTPKEVLIATLFLLGAGYLLFFPEKEEEEKGEEEGAREKRSTPWREALTAFSVIFIGEFGDLTQIQAANFAAKYNWLEVFLGGSLALIAISAIGAYGGQRLQQLVPLAIVRRVGGLVFLGYGVFTIYQLVR